MDSSGVIQHTLFCIFHAFDLSIYRESTFLLVMADYADMYWDVFAHLITMTDENGTQFTEVFPNITDTLATVLVEKILGNMQCQILTRLTEDVGYEINHGLSMEPGSDVYYETYEANAKRYLHSGAYKSAIVESFAISGSYLGTEDDFEDFVDEVYERFYLEAGFDYGFYAIYASIYEKVIEHGVAIVSSADITDIATTYMR